ncbi:hypothetical protein A9Q83_07860 [Alphaproteobacteria bacterium 46_93_T64]|nr:hypothetical protein A9Q83_07860 [Alphaproteobacteria bacterium 46_93_T64]
MRKPQKRAVETRSRILEVARKQAAVSGYEGLRTEEVVKEAGVAKGTLFAHFGDKDQLLLVLMGEELEQAIAVLAELSEKPAFGLKEFQTAMAPLLKLLSRERAIFNLFQFYVGVTSENVSGEIEEECSELQRLISRIVELLQAQGKIRAHMNPDILGEGVLAFLVQAVTFKLCGLYKDDVIAEIEFGKKLDIWLEPSPAA